MTEVDVASKTITFEMRPPGSVRAPAAEPIDPASVTHFVRVGPKDGFLATPSQIAAIQTARAGEGRCITCGNLVAPSATCAVDGTVAP